MNDDLKTRINVAYDELSNRQIFQDLSTHLRKQISVNQIQISAGSNLDDAIQRAVEDQFMKMKRFVRESGQMSHKRDAMHRIDLWRKERLNQIENKKNYIKLLKSVRQAVSSKTSKNETFTEVLSQIQEKVDELHKAQKELSAVRIQESAEKMRENESEQL